MDDVSTGGAADVSGANGAAGGEWERFTDSVAPIPHGVIAPGEELGSRENKAPHFISPDEKKDVEEMSQEQWQGLSLTTRVLHFKTNPWDPYSATSVPLYQTATFRQDSAVENGEYDYSRSGNPTREAFQKLMAEAEGAEKAFAFSTGMTAIHTATQLVNAGNTILAGDDIYGGSDRLLSRVVGSQGVTVRRVDTSNLEAVAAAMTSDTKLLMVESPTNPRQQICDIRKLADIAHSHGAFLLVDNSIQSPVLSNPLTLGADIVMHSATKFVSGHADVMAGVLAVNDSSLADSIAFLQNAQGTALSPMDAWLCLRGVKTMALRVERQQANAQAIASFLSAHPRVKSVLYAGLPTHKGWELHASQSRGPGSVLSFTTGSLALSRYVAENTRLASISVSFGSVNTTISLPCFMSHASIPLEVQQERGLLPDLIRLSVGIEAVKDIIADLDRALSNGPV